ncbi:MAG: hypothetical protein HQL72_01095 [Magnetococcales bacterium]|nr:hypothetical protein [Magnetococcales bacterium]
MGKDQDEEIEKSLRSQRKFSMENALGQAAGGGLLKGVSPIPRQQQVITALVELIKKQCPDPSGAIHSVLIRRLKGSSLSLEDYAHAPGTALKTVVQPLLDNDPLLFEFVRQVDVRWGQLYQERPHFQQPGESPHPDDEYTHDSVRQALTTLLQRLETT